jgi:pimeloyl-ACP methyl ester carboxylesterase
MNSGKDGMPTSDIDVPGGRLSVEDSGRRSDQHDAPVLLLHAGVSDARMWDATVPLLVAAGFRTIRYDVRGYGRSPAPTEPFSLVADALAVLDGSGVDSAHFVGVSGGAATSVDTALAAPTRVRTLTLVAPGVTGYRWPRLPGYERRMAAAERDDAQELALETARLWAPLSFQEGHLVKDLAATTVLDQADLYLAEEMEMEEPDAIPRLGEIGVPTLVVLGDSDVAAITDIGNLLAERIPGARRVVLAGADHILPLRVPERLHELLVEHLTG